MNGVFPRRLSFHEAQALLGFGDLHPGGVAATEFLLRELDKAEPRRVLEVGAGMGRTTERLLRRGWQVTAIEPNEIMRRTLEKRLAIRAFAEGFEKFEDPEPYDALIAESVFYRFDLELAFSRAQRLLRPGGRLALVDMVWTDAADPGSAATVAAETGRIFGIPAVSARPLTWASWTRLLVAAGFELASAERLGAAEPERGRRSKLLLNGLRHPLALASYLQHRKRARLQMVPRGWLESWMSVWRRI